ncbi:MAG: SCP2 sterol-binding domain-containing protein [Cocleimonas sp.]|nr:SCP2 sterol-binding domain-containing protein [Cocleimonas sp.]
MLKKVGSTVLGGVVLGVLSTSSMAVEFMDATWAKQACDAWNKDATLMEKLSQMPEDMFGDGYQWIKNDARRGYKIITMSRDGCKAPKVQLNITEKEGKAICTYGGKLDGKKLNMTVDYYMHATDADWICMGSGKCGVMGSMMTGRLQFSGPKLEAMKVMDPFASFLKLTGKVAATKTACK